MRRKVFDRVTTAWDGIAGVPAGWTPGKITIATSPSSALSPPGWVGVVRLGLGVPQLGLGVPQLGRAAAWTGPAAARLSEGSAAAGALMTAPDDQQAARVRDQLVTATPDQAMEREYWGSLWPADSRRILGPAALAYLDPADFTPLPPSPALRSGGTAADASSLAIEAVDMADVALEIAALETAAGPDDVDEVGITGAQSPLFVIWQGNTVASVCGYRIWVDALAQMMVMSHPDFRGRGFAKRTASAATRHAVDAGLIPQWRARVLASQAVARSLGYTTVGAQLSVRLN